MTNEEQKYIDELKNEILDLEEKLKFITEERDQALLLAQKYQAKYVLEK